MNTCECYTISIIRVNLHFSNIANTRKKIVSFSYKNITGYNYKTMFEL